MKKKFNPAQLTLNLFPIEGVAAVNEASIRDFRRAYWAGDDIKRSWISEEMRENFITRLAMDAAEAKTDLRQMMRRSPNWSESLQAWILPFEIDFPVKPCAVHEMIRAMWQNRGTFDAESYFLPDGENDSFCVAAIERILGRKPRDGMKKSKIFMQVSKALGVYTNERGTVYQRLEGQLFATIGSRFEDGAFQVPKKDVLYVSLNPAHWLSMSNPKHDDRHKDVMTSCHSFNGHYEFKSGCIGYARDNVSLIAFTAAGKGDALLNRKTARQVFFYYDGALLQSRLYTTNTGVGYGGVEYADQHWEYGVFLKLVQDEIRRCTGGRDDWQTEDYRQSESAYNQDTDEYEDIHGYNADNESGLKLNSFGVEVYKGDEFGGYLDWEHFADREGMIKISVRKDKLNRRRWVGQGMFAGAMGLSVRTGEEVVEGESIIA